MLDLFSKSGFKGAPPAGFPYVLQHQKHDRSVVGGFIARARRWLFMRKHRGLTQCDKLLFPTHRDC